MRTLLLSLAFALLIPSLLLAQPKPPKEDDFYQLDQLPVPEGIVLEGGGIALMPNDKIAVSTRRGEIYIVDNAYSADPAKVTFHQFASGLHEVLGLSWKDGAMYATQRCEVTKITDTDKDGRADLFETLSDGWEINGDYHEYAFGSHPDKEGNIWVVLCLTGSFTSDSKYRGWCVRITPEGKCIPTCSGIRSPGGIGMNATGDMFYTDNQGPWNGTCELKFLRPGSFQGHPDSFKWFKLPEVASVLGPAPEQPKSGSRFHIEAKRIKEYEPPVIMFPYGEMGQSAAGIACDTTGGKFGPFTNQLFVGDQTHSTVMRCFLEKIKADDGKEHYQGACFPFHQGFSSGALTLEMAPNGTLLVGTTARGWGSRGVKQQGLDRVTWSGKMPFEIHEMRAKPDGFELTFTQPVDPAIAADPASYKMSTYTYIFQAAYGSPKVDQTEAKITKAMVGPDNKSVRLTVDGLEEGHIHALVSAVKNAEGQPLLHNQAYYTLMYRPK